MHSLAPLATKTFTVSDASRVKLFDRFAQALMRLFTGIWHGCTAIGRLPPTGPVVLIANHPSLADPGFLIAACRRPLHFLHARECYEVPVLRHLYARAGCIPVTRGKPDFEAVRASLRVLRTGGVLALFPEGEVAGEVGSPLRPGKLGAAYLALRGRATVVPARIEGGPKSRRLMGAWLIPSGGVRVTIGERVDLSEYFDRPITRPLLQKVTDLLMKRLSV
jgi:1-acyl-sn-glycerol-3-phosphate acyltransferase